MDIIRKDLTVIGAGVAGMCAAIAAARHGLKVALVHNRPVPGGNASSEVGVTINGAAFNGNGVSVYARETGIVEEIKMKIVELYQDEVPLPYYDNWAMLDAAYLDMIYQEKNIDMFLNTSVYDALVENGSVKSVLAHQINSEREFCFESPLFVDSSGDGTVAFRSGARFMWGEEGRDEFGESLAPEKATKHTMGNTLIFFSRDAGVPKKYTRPDFAYDVTMQPFWKNIKPEFDRPITRNGKLFCGYWWIEIGGCQNVISENEEITKELRKIVYGFWDYIKNSGDFEDVDNLLLDKVTIVPGKRESRRFIGDYILTQNDIDNKTGFFDAIGTGGWTMDSHARNGIYDHDHATYWHYVPGMYNFPYRTLYSKNIDNLFICGRIHSASHMAMSSTRIMATCAVGGQAAGTAAYLCRKYGINPRGITEKYIPELQKFLIRDDQTIIGYPDKEGVALFEGAKIQVSSTKKYENCIDGKAVPLDRDYCLALPYSGLMDSVEVSVKNTAAKAVQLIVELYGGERPENYIPETHIKDICIEIAPGFDGYIVMPVTTEPLGDKKLYFNFKKNENLSLYCNERHYTGFVSFETEDNKEREKYPTSGIITMQRIRENICFKNISPAFDLFGSGNLTNGWTRPYGLPNLWISDDKPGGPQSIGIQFAKPVEIGIFSIIFDTLLEEDRLLGREQRITKKYTLSASNGGGKVYEETLDNCCKRRFQHSINMDGITEITILLHETYGAGYFSVFGISGERKSIKK